MEGVMTWDFIAAPDWGYGERRRSHGSAAGDTRKPCDLGGRVSGVRACGWPAYERRNSSTARTRRDSLFVDGSPSCVKIVETYFSAARSVMTSSSAMPWFELPVAI